MNLRWQTLAALVSVVAVCGCDPRPREIVYLEHDQPAAAADPKEWGRFVAIIERQATAADAREHTDLDSYPLPGCRTWWHTRGDGTISFDVTACPQIAFGAAKGAPCAEVGIWPRWWKPRAGVQILNNRAALYDELRHEFGERVKVVQD